MKATKFLLFLFYFSLSLLSTKAATCATTSLPVSSSPNDVLIESFETFFQIIVNFLFVSRVNISSTSQNAAIYIDERKCGETESKWTFPLPAYDTSFIIMPGSEYFRVISNSSFYISTLQIQNTIATDSSGTWKGVVFNEVPHSYQLADKSSYIIIRLEISGDSYLQLSTNISSNRPVVTMLSSFPKLLSFDSTCPESPPLDISSPTRITNTNDTTPINRPYRFRRFLINESTRVNYIYGEYPAEFIDVLPVSHEHTYSVDYDDQEPPYYIEITLRQLNGTGISMESLGLLATTDACESEPPYYLPANRINVNEWRVGIFNPPTDKRLVAHVFQSSMVNIQYSLFVTVSYDSASIDDGNIHHIPFLDEDEHVYFTFTHRIVGFSVRVVATNPNYILYLRAGSLPTEEEYDVRSDKEETTKIIEITPSDLSCTGELPNNWYVMVKAIGQPITFDIDVNTPEIVHHDVDGEYEYTNPTSGYFFYQLTDESPTILSVTSPSINNVRIGTIGVNFCGLFEAQRLYYIPPGGILISIRTFAPSNFTIFWLSVSIVADASTNYFMLPGSGQFLNFRFGFAPVYNAFTFTTTMYQQGFINVLGTAENRPPLVNSNDFSWFTTSLTSQTNYTICRARRGPTWSFAINADPKAGAIEFSIEPFTITDPYLYLNMTSSIGDHIEPFNSNYYQIRQPELPQNPNIFTRTYPTIRIECSDPSLLLRVGIDQCPTSSAPDTFISLQQLNPINKINLLLFADEDTSDDGYFYLSLFNSLSQSLHYQLSIDYNDNYYDLFKNDSIQGFSKPFSWMFFGFHGSETSVRNIITIDGSVTLYADFDSDPDPSTEDHFIMSSGILGSRSITFDNCASTKIWPLYLAVGDPSFPTTFAIRHGNAPEIPVRTLNNDDLLSSQSGDSYFNYMVQPGANLITIRAEGSIEMYMNEISTFCPSPFINAYSANSDVNGFLDFVYFALNPGFVEHSILVSGSAHTISKSASSTIPLTSGLRFTVVMESNVVGSFSIPSQTRTFAVQVFHTSPINVNVVGANAQTTTAADSTTYSVTCATTVQDWEILVNPFNNPMIRIIAIYDSSSADCGDGATTSTSFLFTTTEIATTGSNGPATTGSDSNTTLPDGERRVETDDPNNINMTPIILGIAIPILSLIICAVIGVWLYKKRRNGKNDQDESDKLNPELQMNTMPNKITDVTIQGRIGGGNFGDVYKGVWGITTVALKKLKNERDVVATLKEAAILRKLSHTNVVQFFGMYETPEGDVYMVTEFMEGGSVSSLVAQRKSELTSLDMLGIARDAAAGLEYLHRCSIAHGDLALRNLLYCSSVSKGSKYLVKIGDFGMSKSIEQQQYYSTTSAELPIRWCSIELLKENKISLASDIWAFGVTIWELYSYGNLPYAGVPNREILELLQTGTRLKQPTGCPDEIFTTLEKCWNENPDERPNMKSIAIQFQSIWLSASRKLPESKHNSIIEESVKSYEHVKPYEHYNVTSTYANQANSNVYNQM